MPSQNYTLTRVTSGEQDLVWDTNTNKYILASSIVTEYTLTIVPTPSDATVTLTAEGYTQSGNSITVPEGLTVIYSIARPGYVQKSDSVVVNSDITLNITLELEEVDPIDESTTVKELEVNSTVYDIVGKGILDQNTKTTQLEWFGTLAEYKALEEYSDYCTYYITDDLGISKEYDLGHLTEIINDFDVDTFKPEVDAIKNEAISDINEATSNSVEQLKNMGEVVNYTNITNCITHIPQDIKVEIDSSNQFIVKGGSKVYYGDGSSATLPSDKSFGASTGFGSEPFVFCIKKSDLSVMQATLNNMSSNATNPGVEHRFWFNTTDGKCYMNDGSGVATETSFPVGIAQHTNNVGWTSIDQVFNGFGYLGSTVFALPGVKGLMPNGRNADGSLKSNVLNITSVKTYAVHNTAVKEIRITSSGLWGYVGYIVSDTAPSVNFNMWYNPVENIMYDTGGSGTPYALIATVGISVEYDGTRITSLTPKTVFHAVDYSDFKPIQDHSVIEFQAPTSANSYKWYRKYADGWIEQGGQTSVSANATLAVTLSKKMANTNYFCTASGIHNSVDDRDYMGVAARSTTTITIANGHNAAVTFVWQVCGMAA